MLQVRNLEKMDFSDEAVMKLTLDIIQITHGVYMLCVMLSLVLTGYCTGNVETLEAGHGIEELLSHGIDLLSYILPKNSSEAELRCVLFLLQNVCHTDK